MTAPMSRGRQRLGGLGLFLLGAAMTAWEWKTALIDGYYHPKAAVLFPCFAWLGLGLLLFPGYREERLARGESLEGRVGLRLLTPRWWAILATGLALGFGHWWFMARMPSNVP